MSSFFTAPATRDLAILVGINGQPLINPVAHDQLSLEYTFTEGNFDDWERIPSLTIEAVSQRLTQLAIGILGPENPAIKRGLAEDVLFAHLVRRILKTGFLPINYCKGILREHFQNLPPQSIVAEACIAASFPLDYIPLPLTHSLRGSAVGAIDGVMFIPFVAKDRTDIPAIVDVWNMPLEVALELLKSNNPRTIIGNGIFKGTEDQVESLIRKIERMGKIIHPDLHVGLMSVDEATTSAVLPLLASVKYLREERDGNRLKLGTVTDTEVFQRLVSDNIDFLKAAIELKKIDPDAHRFVCAFIKYLEDQLKYSRTSSKYMTLDDVTNLDEVLRAENISKIAAFGSNFLAELKSGAAADRSTIRGSEAFHLFSTELISTLEQSGRLDEIELQLLVLKLFARWKINEINISSKLYNIFLAVINEYNVNKFIERFIKNFNKAVLEGDFDPIYPDSWALIKHYNLGSQIVCKLRDIRGRGEVLVYSLGNINSVSEKKTVNAGPQKPRKKKKKK